MTSTSGNRYIVPLGRDHGNIHHIGQHVVVTGEQLQMACIYMPPEAEVGWHSHPQESFVTVIQGGYELWVGSEQFTLGPGQACWIPANTAHRAIVGPEPTVEIEVFSPPREEWAELTPQFDFRRGQDIHET